MVDANPRAVLERGVRPGVVLEEDPPFPARVVFSLSDVSDLLRPVLDALAGTHLDRLPVDDGDPVADAVAHPVQCPGDRLEASVDKISVVPRRLVAAGQDAGGAIRAAEVED